MTNYLTHKQAMALAAFINAIRPDWDKPGIENALGKARELAPGPDLAVAAIKASQLATNRTPSVIGMEGPHWRGSEVRPRYDAVPRHEMCSVCSQHRDVCRRRWEGDHEFLPLTAPRAEAAAEHITALRRESLARADALHAGVWDLANTADHTPSRQPASTEQETP